MTQPDYSAFKAALDGGAPVNVNAGQPVAPVPMDAPAPVAGDRVINMPTQEVVSPHAQLAARLGLAAPGVMDAGASRLAPHMPDLGAAAQFAKDGPAQMSADVNAWAQAHPGNARLVNSAKDTLGGFPLGAVPDISLRQPTFTNNTARDVQPNTPGAELHPLDTGRIMADNAHEGPYAKPLQLTRPQVGGAGGYGGGGPGDFGVGAARRRFEGDQEKQVGDFDTQKDLAATRGVIESDDARSQAEIQANTRYHLEDLARIDQERHAMEQKQLASWQADTDKKNEDISTQKIDPTRIFHNQSDGDKFAFILAASIGGALQGAGLTSSNATLDQANKMMDRDIAAQKDAIDNKRAGLQQRNTMYGQYLQQYGRADLASMETKSSMFESAKLQLSELAAQTNDPLAKQRAKEQIAGFQMEQDKLRTSIDAGRFQTAQQGANAWAAQQAAASRKAAEERHAIIVRAQHISDQGATNGKPVSPEDAYRRATYEMTGNDIAGGNARPMADYSKDGEGGKDAAKLAVTLPDGTVKQAQSQEAKDKYVEFESIKQAYAGQNASLQQAWKARDKAAYEAARGQLIEMMPTMYGFGRGPSKLQGMEQDEHGQKGTLTAAVPTWDEMMRSQIVSGIPLVGDTNFVQNTLAGGSQASKFKALDRLVGDLEASREKAAFGETTARPQGVPLK